MQSGAPVSRQRGFGRAPRGVSAPTLTAAAPPATREHPLRPPHAALAGVLSGTTGNAPLPREHRRGRFRTPVDPRARVLVRCLFATPLTCPRAGCPHATDRRRGAARADAVETWSRTGCPRPGQGVQLNDDPGVRPASPSGSALAARANDGSGARRVPIWVLPQLRRPRENLDQCSRLAWGVPPARKLERRAAAARAARDATPR